MKILIDWNFKTINTRSKVPIQLLVTVLILSVYFGCSKEPKGAIKVVEGIVFEDCDGNVSKGNKVILQLISSGHWHKEIISEESTLTDNNGFYRFEYREAVNNDGSSIGYYHSLTIPNSTISISNPTGNFDLFPYDTLMNAFINLKFINTYTSNDTFYYQFKPSPTGFIEESEQIQYFVGPFHDTTLILDNLRIGNTNSGEKGHGHCGEFKWSIGKVRLNSYYTGYDGYFAFTHEPCFVTDTFNYLVDPNY